MQQSLIQGLHPTEDSPLSFSRSLSFSPSSPLSYPTPLSPSPPSLFFSVSLSPILSVSLSLTLSRSL